MKNYKKILVLGGIGSLVFAMVTASTPVLADTTFVPISGSSILKVGSKNTNVTNLQNFLASDKDIYPAGTVTGYFGGLTSSAVGQFQNAYDLSADGIAGPATIAKVNSVIGAGRGIDITEPVMSVVALSMSGRNTTFSFSTNKVVKATVFYDTNPLNLQESSLNFGVPIISGAQTSDATFSSSKQIVLNNLNANSTYNYTVMVTDMSGNVSLIWPQAFTTGQ